MSDTITLPREVVKFVLQHLEWWSDDEPQEKEAIEALRTALAAPPPKPPLPVAWGIRYKTYRTLVNITTNPQTAHEWRRAKRTGVEVLPLYTAPPATHPGYVIGSHWLETAYSRVCAGEAEADVLRDIGWERVDEALRRDAERYRWLRERAWFQFEFDGRYGDSGETLQELDAAIDAAMEEGKR